MFDPSPGQILVADHQGVYVIKMIGDVRLTLCVSFDDYIKTLFDKNDFCTISFDLIDTQGLDSTTLGLIAKIAVKSVELKGIRPAIICENNDILRLLSSMGLDDVCQIIDAPPENYCSTKDFSGLTVCDTDECVVKEKVLESHCILMGLNETNRETFKDLVHTLEEDRRA